MIIYIPSKIFGGVRDENLLCRISMYIFQFQAEIVQSALMMKVVTNLYLRSLLRTKNQANIFKNPFIKKLHKTLKKI